AYSRANKVRRVLEVQSGNTVLGDLQYILTVSQPATHIHGVIDSLLVCKVLDPVVPDHIQEDGSVLRCRLHAFDTARGHTNNRNSSQQTRNKLPHQFTNSLLTYEQS